MRAAGGRARDADRRSGLERGQRRLRDVAVARRGGQDLNFNTRVPSRSSSLWGVRDGASLETEWPVGRGPLLHSTHMATEERQWTDAERWYRERYSATPERRDVVHDALR